MKLSNDGKFIKALGKKGGRAHRLRDASRPGHGFARPAVCGSRNSKLRENNKMIRNNLTMTLVGALTVVCGLTEHGLTQAPAKQSPRQAPIFQVDSTWPKLPNNWILGPVSSVAVGPDDHVWIVHRPRSLSEAKRAQAAPPVLEFDSAGKFDNPDVIVGTEDRKSPRLNSSHDQY